MFSSKKEPSFMCKSKFLAAENRFCVSIHKPVTFHCGCFGCFILRLFLHVHKSILSNNKCHISA